MSLLRYHIRYLFVRIILLSIAGVFTLPVLAGELRRPVQGIRNLGMGNVGIALSFDENALFYNPAGLASVDSIILSLPFLNEISEDAINISNEVSKLCGIDAKNFNPSKESSSKNQQQLNNLPPKVEAPVRVKALVNIFIALLEYPKIAQQDIFDELLTDKKFNFLLRIIELFKEDSNIKPSRIIENIESDKIKAYFSEAVISELVLSENNAIKLVEDCIDVLLKNQKDREQSLKDKYNVNSITSVERRDLQQIILKKENISDDDRKWLEKLSSNLD